EYFGVVRAHGGGNDDSADAFNVLRAVPNRYTGPQCLQPTRHGRGLQVRPADRVAQVEQDLCYAAHAGAANADEVDALYTVLHGFLRATCSQASAIKRVADRHACSWACSATRLSTLRSSERNHSASHSGVNSDCLRTHAPSQSAR